MKYKVGEMVGLIHASNCKFHILTTLVEECCGGVQIHYIGRVHIKEKYGINNTLNPARELSKYTEIELRSLPVPSKETMKLVKDLKMVRDKKLLCINEQNFDEAAKLRDEERKMTQELRLRSDAEGDCLTEF